VVRRALLVAALLGAGCRSGGGEHFELRVHPTAAAQAGATSLEVDLARSDGSDSRSTTLALPSPTPSPPWLLDVQTGAWGAAAFGVVVTASGANGAISRGVGQPAAGVIDVQLADLAASDGGTDLAPRDGGAADGGMPDLVVPLPDLRPLPDLQCGTNKLVAFAEADNTLAPMSPDLNFGTLTVANVGVGVSTNGLFRFDIAALPVNARIVKVRVVFAYAAKSANCLGQACSSCDALEMPGTLSMFFARSDWVESTSTWNQYDTNKSWGAAGCTQAGVDRSNAPVATGQHAVTMDTAFDINPNHFAEVGVWRSGNKLSVELVPSNGVVAIIATRENANEGCGVYPKPTLEIDYCP
jgi:hypothetical protein